MTVKISAGGLHYHRKFFRHFCFLALFLMSINTSKHVSAQSYASEYQKNPLTVENPDNEKQEKRAWFGSNIMDITKVNIRAQSVFSQPGEPGYICKTGVVVVQVIPGSPSDLGGLREADIICVINGKVVESEPQAFQMLTQFTPGKKIKLTVARTQGTKELEVVLGEKGDFSNLLISFGKVPTEAQLLVQQTGHYEESIRIIEDALMFYEKNFGKRKGTGYVRTQSLLAQYYALTGAKEKSDRGISEVTMLSDELFEKSDPLYKGLINLVAMAHKYYQAYQANQVPGQGKRSPEVEKAVSLRLEANQLSSQGKDIEAIELARESLEIIKNSVGEQDLNYIEATGYLAQLYFLKMKDYKKAEPLFLLALKQSNAISGGNRKIDMDIAHNLAFLYDTIGKHELAEGYWLKRISVSRKIFGQETIEYLGSTGFLVNHYVNREKWEMAIPVVQEQIPIAKKVYGEKEWQVLSLMGNLAIYFQKLKRYDESESIILEILRLNKELYGEMSTNYAMTLMLLADLNNLKGDQNNAMTLRQKGLPIFKEILGEKNPTYLNYFYAAAVQLVEMSEFDKAEVSYQKLIKVLETVPEQNEFLAKALSTLAWDVYIETGKYQEAESLLLQSLTVLKETPDNYVGVGLINGKLPIYYTLQLRLAALYHTLGEYEKCEPIYRELEKSFASTLDSGNNPIYLLKDIRLKLVALWTNSGLFYLSMGEYEKAENLFISTLEMCKKLNEEDSLEHASTLSNLAWLYTKMDKLDKAETFAKQANAVMQENFGENHPFQWKILSGFIPLYLAKHDYEKARVTEERIVQIIEKTSGQNTLNYADALSQLGTIAGKIESYDQAQEHFSKALKVARMAAGESHPTYSNILEDMSLVLIKSRQFDVALEAVAKSLQALNPFIESLTYWATEQKMQGYLKTVEQKSNLLYSLLSVKSNETKSFVQEAFEVHMQYKGRTLDAMARRNRVAAFSTNPKLAQIIKDLKETTRRHAYLTLNKPEKMELKKYRNMLAGLEQKKELLEDGLARGAAEFADMKATATVSVNNVLNSLPAGGVYLDFVSYEKYDLDASKSTKELHYLAFVVSKGHSGEAVIKVEELGPSREIDGLVNKFRNVLKGETQIERGVGGVRLVDKGKKTALTDGLIHDMGIRLYDKILNPFKAELEESTALYISPAGNLNLIPFEVLSIPENKGYLSDKKTVLYTSGRDLYSASLSRNLATKTKQKDLIIVAAPDFSNTTARVTTTVGLNGVSGMPLTRGSVPGWPIKFDPIPGTLKEAKQIKLISKDNNAALYTGSAATENRVKASHVPTILHLATHGFFLEKSKQIENDVATRGVGGINQLDQSALAEISIMKGDQKLYNPLLRSGLVFAGANRLADNIAIPENEDDGILTASEVTGMDLYGTDLVVLSACETGLGEVQRGEGVSGLRRAFKIAGAKNVIMSLWNVPDEETAWLMESFYKNYLAGDKPSTSLNKARETVKERLIKRDGIAHPYYWAAFILEGTD